MRIVSSPPCPITSPCTLWPINNLHISVHSKTLKTCIPILLGETYLRLPLVSSFSSCIPLYLLQPGVPAYWLGCAHQAMDLLLLQSHPFTFQPAGRERAKKGKHWPLKDVSRKLQTAFSLISCWLGGNYIAMSKWKEGWEMLYTVLAQPTFPIYSLLLIFINLLIH